MDNPQKTSASLILKVANQRDFEAWNRFSSIYEPLVYRIALAKGLQTADAEDLVQEVMTRVARSVGKWEPDSGKGTFRGWISTIARNLVVDFLRRKTRTPVTSDRTEIRKLVEGVSDTENELEYFDREYERQLFINASNDIRGYFAQSTWQAFWETAVKNEPIARVANRLGMSPGAIYVARSRVMSRLKRRIQAIHNCEEVPEDG